MVEAVVTPLTPEQVSAIANAGPGPLADLAKQAKDQFALDREQAQNYGPGFVSDMLKSSEPPLPPNHTASIENIANANPANIKVSAADWPNFPVGTKVLFNGTGFTELDTATEPFTVTFVNDVGKTFKVDCDLSSWPAPGGGGMVTTVPEPVAASEPVKTILDEPPIEPERTTQIPNGYEQAAADNAAAEGQEA